MGDSFTFALHVGCPSAASNDTYIFVDFNPMTTYISGDSSSNISIANVSYQSLSQSLPFTCMIQATYQSISVLNYVDYTSNGNTSAPMLS